MHSFPNVAFDIEKGEAATAFVEGVEDIGPAAAMPLKYVQWVGKSEGVLIEHILLPGDEITVKFDVTPYPATGNSVRATAELIPVGEAYKPARTTHTTQNVVRKDPSGNPTPFIETTTTTYYERMRYPLGPGQYLISRESFDAAGRVTASGSARIDIMPLPFTLADARRKAALEPQDFMYFHPGNVWLFYKDGVTTFVSKDVREDHPGDYLILARTMGKSGESVNVDVFDEIKDATAPLLGLLFDAGYTKGKAATRLPMADENAWNLSKAMDSLSGKIGIKDGNLLQFARDLDKWGYRADGTRIRKK
jgi:hypothetical protein